MLLALVASCCLVGITGCTGNESEKAATSRSAEATASSFEEFATLPTRKCPTSEGIEIPDKPLEAETTVPVSSKGLDGFAAFANTTGSVLIGPNGWKCRSTVSVDGGETIALSPDGSDPFDDEAEIGITYDASVACQGCIASEICAILPNAPVVLQYRDIGCDRTKPLKEILTPIGDFSVMFEDSPGVNGQGDPSGGSTRSIGMLTYSEYRGVQQVSCAIPEEIQEACPSIVSGSMLHALAHLSQG